MIFLLDRNVPMEPPTHAAVGGDVLCELRRLAHPSRAAGSCE